MEYKTLAKEFRSKGFTCKQVCREKDLAVYERTKEGHTYPHYEVIRIRTHDGYVIAGTTIVPSETYPSSEKWGTDGFTCNTKQEAYVKMDWMKKLQLEEDVVSSELNEKNEIVVVTKRKRGRPRNATPVTVAAKVKRGRGRPRKNAAK